MPEYTVVPAHLQKDRQVILDLWRRNLASVHRLEEKYDWHFLNNPAGRGQIWILKVGGLPIGTAALGMRHIKLGDSLTLAAVACDLAVNNGHRFLQPALLLQRTLMSSACSAVRIIYGVPNPGGAAVLKYVGYRESCPVHRYAKVLRVSPYLRRSGKFGSIAPYFGDLADRGFAALQSFGRPSFGRTAQVLPLFDERFDELWRRSSSQLPALLVRDRRFLNWRYRECPLSRYQTLGLLSEDQSQLLGYLIYYVEDHAAIGVDLFVPGGAHHLDCLLSSWAAVAFRAGLASLSLTCSNDALAADLARHNFTQRSVPPQSKPDRTRRHEQCKTLFTHDRHPAAAPAFADRWYYTEGDSPY